MPAEVIMRALVIGSKEYPFGSWRAEEDPLPSGGMELYVDRLVPALLDADPRLELTVVTRRFAGQPGMETQGRLKVVRVPFSRGAYLRNPSFNLQAFRAALRLEWDVLIAHGEIAQLFGLLAGRLKRKPVVMVCHGTATNQPQYPRPVRWAFRAIELLTYRWSAANITHSPHQLERITTKFTVVMPGGDTRRSRRTAVVEQARLRKELGIGKEKVILFAGRLVAVKGVEYLLRALKDVREPHVCVIVGEGGERGRLERLARARGARVVFTGFRKDVSAFLSVADVFALPSLSESLNYSVREAAAMGVPLVVTDLGIMPPDAAVIVPVADAAALAAGINAVFENPGQAERRAACAHRFVAQFRWEQAAAAYLQVLRRVA